MPKRLQKNYVNVTVALRDTQRSPTMQKCHSDS